MSLKVLHFADAHIDIANYGRHDPETGLPVRVLDFLKSLDEIVDTAIAEKVDLVLFAGDAYKDRNPAPTFQREWGRRIIRLSKAGIPVLLLVGNHDLSPSLGRAHALEEYNTLEIQNVRVLAKPEFLGPDQLWGLPLQLVALPWVARSQMMAISGMEASKNAEIVSSLEEILTEQVENYLAEAAKQPDLPTVLLAHASVQGALYGSERSVMLGTDVVLSGGLVKDPRFDYVALGHIHKKQDVNEKGYPAVVYPGSIERVDFGEAQDDKFFVIVNIAKGKTTYKWRQLKKVRPFFDFWVRLDSEEGVMQKLMAKLPAGPAMKDAIVRFTIDYPRELEPFIDEGSLREAAAETFEFHLVKRPQMEARLRIPEDQSVSELSPVELLDIYWKSSKMEDKDRQQLSGLAQKIIEDSPVKD
jgi:exonuclease SbcD